MGRHKTSDDVNDLHEYYDVAAREPIPRGVYIGERVGGPPQDEAEHFYRCAECGGWVDERDLGSVFDHEAGGLHLVSDKSQ